jgi:quinol monooxygenase YgiN
MTIYKMATYNVRTESIENIKNAVREYVAAVIATEPGTVLYLSMQDRINPQRFVHLASYRDEPAEALHRDSVATKRFSAAISSAVIGDVSFSDFNLIAST